MTPSTTSYDLLNGWTNEIQTMHFLEDQRAFNHMSEQNSSLISDNRHVQVLYNSELFPTGAMFAWGKPRPTSTFNKKIQNDTENSHHHAKQDNGPLLPFSNAWAVNEQSDDSIKTNPDKAVLIHNNWIVGYAAKKERFIQSELWLVPQADSFHTTT